MMQDRQKYLETLLFEWLVLDFQPLYLLKSPSFRRFINALNENFELPSDKEFRKRLSCTAHTIQLVVGKGLLAAEVLIARAKRLINFFTSPKQNERLLDAQKKNSEDPEEEGDLHTIFYRAITDVETHWSSTFIAW